MYLLLAHLQIANILERRLAELMPRVPYSVEGDSRVLTVNQALTLMQMLDRTRDDIVEPAPPKSVNEIAAELGWRRSNTQACVATLQDVGLVALVGTKTMEGSSRRIPCYALSAQGIEISGSVKVCFRQCESDLCRQLRRQKLGDASKALAHAAYELAKSWDSGHGG